MQPQLERSEEFNTETIAHKSAGELMAEDAKQKPLTREEYKKAMRVYFTVRRPIVNDCGHKIDPESVPKSNCEACWFAWFNNHGELVQQLDGMYNANLIGGGPDFLVNQHGKKFVKNWLKFMSTVARLKAEADALMEKNGENRSTDSATSGEIGEVQATGNARKETE